MVMDKRQLLFIEDQSYVVDRVNAILDDFPQFEVTRTGDADKARKLLEEKAFDIVITDIYLSGASGLEFSFKAREKNPDACVIMITGLDNADLAEKAVKEGAFDFVIRPPGLERIASMLKMVSMVRGLKPPED